MQEYYGFDSTIGLGRTFGFKAAGEALPPLEKPVITSIDESVDMAGLRLEFAQFGDFDNFSIYRSDTPMDVNSLPAPIATGLATMHYVDDAVVDGATYYYRVSVSRGADNQTSDEVSFTVPSVNTGTGHKWWRIANIEIRTPGSLARHAAEIRFNDIQEYTFANAFSNSFTNRGEPWRAFDNDTGTSAGSNSSTSGAGANGLDWYIGYKFNDNIVVNAVSLMMLQNVNYNFGTEWQTADIEVSDDGIEWVKYGTIEPRIAQMNLTLVTTPVIPI